MNIFELFGTIAINNDGAHKSLDSTRKKANSTADAVGKAFDKMGKVAVKAGKTIAVGLAAGTTAVTALVGKAMGYAGELEQNMGGAEAVFGDYADRMKEKAANAYKEMGLSQSDYLATANKMGSLFKGVGYTQQEAADLSAQAMQRAADVASIMGIDISTAMESIAGAAKGNFTMMDNLGVAINDTAIANYALAKGISKTTSEMTTQEKVHLAMEMFLEKTADYAGTYAKENDTLAGSLTTAKAAFENFLAGSGTAEAVAESFANAGKQIAIKAGELLPHLTEGIQTLFTELAPVIKTAWETNVWPNIQDLFKAKFGIELPEWADIETDFTTWWTGTKTSIENFCTWTLKLFDSPREAAEDAGNAISAWWTGTALPGILAVSSWALPLFGHPVEDNATIEEHVKAWWDTAGDAVAGICTWTLKLFNVPSETAEDVGKKVGAWWDTVSSKAVDACSFMARFVGIGEWTEADDEALSLWWDEVGQKFLDVCTWVINPPKLPDPNTMVQSIQNWWIGVRSQLKLTFGITPQVEAKVNAYQSDLESAGGGNALAQTYIESTSYNPEAAGIQSGVNALIDMFRGHRSGLDYVPYDEYFARLHEGEAVLTRAEADVWRSGGAGTGSTLALLQEIARNTAGGKNIVLNTGVLVGQLAPAMDAQLGTIGSRKGRGA